MARVCADQSGNKPGIAIQPAKPTASAMNVLELTASWHPCNKRLSAAVQSQVLPG
jgi:hypothetical protein